MRVIIVGDPSGNTDEGMKKVAIRLNQNLNGFENCNSSVLSTRDIFRDRSVRNRPLILHFMGGPSWRTLLAAAAFKFFVNTKAIIIISFIHPEWGRFSEFLFNILRPSATLVQTEKWMNAVPRSTKKISHIPLGGVSLNKFRRISVNEKSEFKKELGLPLDKIVVLHVGHLNQGRNLGAMCDFKSSPDIYPMVIGSSTVAPDKDLVRMLKSNGVEVINRYLPDVEKYYMAADCYLFPTINSDFAIQLPLSVLESLSCGTPVLATKYEALPFFLNEMPPLLNYTDSLDGLDRIIRDIHSEALSANLELSLDLSRFEWKSISKQLLELYTNLLKDV